MNHQITLLVLVAFLVNGCASTPQMTPEEREAHETDRVEKYVIWHSWCMAARLQILSVHRPGGSPRRCSRRVSICVPHRRDWDFYYLSEERINKQRPGTPTWRPKVGNIYQCGKWRFR